MDKDNVEINDDCLSSNFNQLEREGRASGDNRTVATYVKARPVATYGHGKGHSHSWGTQNRKRRTIHACSNVPTISDSTTWNIWKTDITKPLGEQPTQMGINAAIYFFCKISML